MLRQKDISWQDIVVFGGRKVELMVARLLKPLSSLFASSSSPLFTSPLSSLFVSYSSFFSYPHHWHVKKIRRKISLRWTANWRQNEEGWSHSLLLPFGHRLQVCWQLTHQYPLPDWLHVNTHQFIGLALQNPYCLIVSDIKIQLFKWKPPSSLAKLKKKTHFS